MNSSESVPDIQARLTAEEIARRQQIVSRNSGVYLRRWEAGEIDPHLYAYQEPAFKDLLEHTHDSGKGTISSGYLDEPTSFGKTVLIARYLEAVGIGTLPESNGSQLPLRAFVGTMSRSAVRQIASVRDTTRGFKKFLPNMNITACFTEQKDPSGDAAVFTYRMLLLLAQAGKLSDSSDYYFDVIIGDEAHNLLGKKTSHIWRQLTLGKHAIGLTASPEYGPHKKLDLLFDRLIHRSQLRGLVKSGKLSGIQLLGFATNATIVRESKRAADFTEAELQPLLRNQTRNQAICDIAAQLIAEGRRGVINAIPGENLYHAQLLAGALHGREIIDEQGNKRTIRATSIGSHISSSENDKRQEAFESGKYDVVVQVGKWNQSYDNENLTFGINAVQTCSKVRAIQRVGRIMRRNEDWPIKVIVEIIDNVVNASTYTAWHVLEEEDIKQGAIVAQPEVAEAALAALAKEDQEDSRQEEGDSPKATRGKGPFLIPNQRDFNELLAGMYRDYELRLINRATIGPQETYGPPPKGWRELIRVVAEKYSDTIGLEAIRALLERKGGEAYCILAKGFGPTYFISPEGEAFLEEYELPSYAPTTEWKTARELMPILDTSLHTIHAYSEDLPATDYISRQTLRVAGHFSPEQIKVIRQRVNETKEQKDIAKDLIAAKQLAEEVNWDRASIHFFLMMHHDCEGQLLASPNSGHKSRCYTEEEAELVRRHCRHSCHVTVRALKQGMIIDLEQALGKTREEIVAIADELGLRSVVHDARFKQNGKYVYTEIAEPAIAEQIKQHLETLTQKGGELETRHQPQRANASPPQNEVNEVTIVNLDESQFTPQTTLSVSRGPTTPATPAGSTEATHQPLPEIAGIPIKRVARKAPIETHNKPPKKERPAQYRTNLIEYLRHSNATCDSKLIPWLIKLHKLQKTYDEDGIMWASDQTASGLEAIIKQHPIAARDAKSVTAIAEMYSHFGIQEEHIVHLARQLSTMYDSQRQVCRMRLPNGSVGELRLHFNSFLTARVEAELNEIVKDPAQPRLQFLLRRGRLLRRTSGRP